MQLVDSCAPGRVPPPLLFGFPVEPAERTTVGPEFCHALGVVDHAVLHDISDTLDVRYVVQWICIENEEVGKLAGHERTEVSIETDLLGTAKRRSTQCLEGRHAPCHEHI